MYVGTVMTRATTIERKVKPSSPRLKPYRSIYTTGNASKNE